MTHGRPSTPFLLAFAGVAGLGVTAAWAALSPEGFTGFLWQHVGGPIAAQAALAPSAEWRGIEGRVGYTAPSLVLYSSILSLALAGLHRLVLDAWGLSFDRRLALALAPFLVLGPLVRAVQDSGFLLRADGTPLGISYVVVEPLVYATTAALALAGLALDRSLPWADERRSLLLVLAALSAVTVSFLGFFGLAPLQSGPPAWLVLLAIPLGALSFRLAGAGRTPGAAALAFGVAVLWPVAVLAGSWVLGDAAPWRPPPGWEGNHPLSVPLVVGASVLVALGIVALARPARRLPGRMGEVGEAASSPLAGTLVFAHAFDAVSTVFAIRDPLGWGVPAYAEQNPFSAFLLSFGGGWGFVVAKIVMAVILAVLVADFDREDEGRADVAGFLALVVFVLGFGPGARNLARLAMGV